MVQCPQVCNLSNAEILLSFTVYGWFNDSLTGVEQGPGISVPVGYQKGAAQARQNFVFNIIDQPVTASMYITKIA